LGGAARLTPLHVDDLAVAKGQDLVALSPATAFVRPHGRADDRVLPDLREVGSNVDPPPAALSDLEFQDLTGLVGASSGRGSSPPEVALRDPSPLCVLREQCCERLRVSTIQRFGRRTKLLEHAMEYAYG